MSRLGTAGGGGGTVAAAAGAQRSSSSARANAAVQAVAAAAAAACPACNADSGEGVGQQADGGRNGRAWATTGASAEPRGLCLVAAH